MTWKSDVGEVLREPSIGMIRAQGGNQIGVGNARCGLSLIQLAGRCKSLSECEVGASYIAGRDSGVGFIAKEIEGLTSIGCGRFGVAASEFDLRSSNQQRGKIGGALADPANRGLIERDSLVCEASGRYAIVLSQSVGRAGRGDLGEDVVCGRISPAQSGIEFIE